MLSKLLLAAILVVCLVCQGQAGPTVRGMGMVDLSDDNDVATITSQLVSVDLAKGTYAKIGNEFSYQSVGSAVTDFCGNAWGSYQQSPTLFIYGKGVLLGLDGNNGNTVLNQQLEANTDNLVLQHWSWDKNGKALVGLFQDSGDSSEFNYKFGVLTPQDGKLTLMSKSFFNNTLRCASDFDAAHNIYWMSSMGLDVQAMNPTTGQSLGYAMLNSRLIVSITAIPNSQPAAAYVLVDVAAEGSELHRVTFKAGSSYLSTQLVGTFPEDYHGNLPYSSFIHGAKFYAMLADPEMDNNYFAMNVGDGTVEVPLNMNPIFDEFQGGLYSMNLVDG